MPSKEDLAEMLDHVGYEWWMFRAAFQQLKLISRDGDVILNALVESLAIHGRGLICFFFVTRPFDGDIHCAHYDVPRDAMPSTGVVADWKFNADKRIAHVTDTRLDSIGSWPTSELYRVLAEKIAQLRQKVGALPHDDAPTTTIHTLKTFQDGSAVYGENKTLTTTAAYAVDIPVNIETSGTKSALGGSVPATPAQPQHDTVASMASPASPINVEKK